MRSGDHATHTTAIIPSAAKNPFLDAAAHGKADSSLRPE
jgi:hypothetical protein